MTLEQHKKFGQFSAKTEWLWCCSDLILLNFTYFYSFVVTVVVVESKHLITQSSHKVESLLSLQVTRAKCITVLGSPILSKATIQIFWDTVVDTVQSTAF